MVSGKQSWTKIRSHEAETALSNSACVQILSPKNEPQQDTRKQCRAKPRERQWRARGSISDGGSYLPSPQKINFPTKSKGSCKLIRKHIHHAHRHVHAYACAYLMYMAVIYKRAKK